MKENKDSEIEAWLEKADHDLGSAKIIFLHEPKYYEVIAFHCQQAVEKYLKATLVYFNIPFKKSHDLVYLLELLSVKTEISSEIYTMGLTLNDFSVEVRYPNVTIHLSKAELEEAINLTEELRDFALAILTKK